MKLYYIAAMLLLISGCAETENKTQLRTDQCMRAEIFKECIKHTQVNLRAISLGEDGDGIGDAVNACENAAYYQSRREAQYIKPECKA